MSAVKIAALAVAACAFAPTGAVAAPAPADLDLGFGKSGNAPVAGTFQTQARGDMALGLRDEIFVLTSNVHSCVGFSECVADWTVARFTRNGKRDTAFGSGPNSSLQIRQNEYQGAGLAVGPDGKPVVAAIDFGGLIVGRFDRSGQLDATFGAGGRTTERPFSVTRAVPQVAVQPDGKVVVAGEAYPGPGVLLARYQADGRLDPSFGSGGWTTIQMGSTGRPTGLVIGEDGTIAVGASECCKGEGGVGPAVGVARLLGNGSLDGSFGQGGVVLLPTPEQGWMRTLVAGPGRKLYALVGEERIDAILVRLRANGSLDPKFGRNGAKNLFPVPGFPGISEIATDGAGRLAGVSGMGGGIEAFRLRADGRADRTFGGGFGVDVKAPVAQAASPGIAIQSNGRIVVLGESGCCGKAFVLARLTGGSSRARCFGRRATIVGTRGRDELTGTRGNDVIAALGGADKVRALGGDDLICGGGGEDSLGGGPGRDEVRP